MAVLMLGLMVGGRGGAQPLTAPTVEQIRQSLAGEVDTLILKYRTWDQGYKEGQGNSAASTSGGLGWGEAQFLRDYVYMYRVTRDTYWLDKIVDHADRMKASQKVNAAGFRAWSDDAYSVNVITAAPVGEVGAATLTPPTQRINKRRDQPDVNGHEYELSFPQATAWVLRDVTAGQQVAAGEYDGQKLVCKEVAPGTLTLAGAVNPGARFAIKTVAPQALEYQVHDGMVTYHLAQFIEIVLTTPELAATHGAKAREYLAWLDRDFLQKWEPTWRELPAGEGLYAFCANPTQRFPNYSLPHNQYLALARTWLVLGDLKDFVNAPLARQRATAMARFYHRNLRAVNGAYEWNYWDPLPGEDLVRVWVEDFSHGTIDVGFAIEAAARGVVFTPEDVKRFASTYVDVMWNGDRQKPRFGARVNTKEGDKIAWADYFELAVADPRVWTLAEALFADQRQPVTMIASVLEVRRRLTAE
jgi:hypothetical protein